jgi:NADH pyrophosphatase NudC (nudix superfamily)
MNPLFFLAPLLQKFRRTRFCSACGHKQYVPADKLDKQVSCESCGRSIPPPHKPGQPAV